MRLSRRQFTTAAGGALAFASTPALLRRAGLAAEEPIRVGNILDQTGGLNIYSLKQIKALAMAVDEINQAGGLLGRPLELFFYDSQSNNQFNSQYATQALVRDKVQVIHGGITSSSREVMRPIVRKYKGLLFYNSLYEGGVCDRRHVNTGMVPAQQLEPLVDYVVKEKGARRATCWPPTTTTARSPRSGCRSFGEAGGEAVAVEFFPLDVTNFAPAISRIQAAKPDVVWSALVGGAHIAFYRQFEATIGKKNMMLASTTYGVGRENTQLSPRRARGHRHRDLLRRRSADPGRQGLRREVQGLHRRGRVRRRVRRVRLSRPDAVGRGGQEGGRRAPDAVIEALARAAVSVRRRGRPLHDRRQDPAHDAWTCTSRSATGPARST